jgi:Ran GTPase-activating protein (RanGAP) involved in mRNA processing and transport
MPGDDPPILCPVHLAPITPCPPDELEPLLAHLSGDTPVTGSAVFPRGTLVEDGRLDLCKQSLGPENCQRVVAALEGNTHIRSLMLGTDGIGDVGATAVADLAKKNPQLEVLYLGCNKIGPAGAEALSDALAHNSSVTGLWLKRNPLGPEGAQKLAAMLRTNQSLRVLDLVNTDLRATGFEAIVAALCETNRSVERLYLSGNGLGPAQAPGLARLLHEAPHVKALLLSVNRLADDGAALLAEALRENTTLEELDLASNGIGTLSALAVLEAALAHPRLHTLSLGYTPSTRVLGSSANALGDKGAFALATLLPEAKTLRRLDLRRNGLSPRGIAALVEALEHNHTLVDLQLDGKPNPKLAALLERNQAQSLAPLRDPDVALIRSVYR